MYLYIGFRLNENIEDMKTVTQKVPGYLYKTALTNPGGIPSPSTVQRAFNVGAITEDLDVSNFENNPEQQPQGFLIIPLQAGDIKVHLAGAPAFEDYLISEVETTASLGLPMLYLVDKIYVDGTTAELNIGW